MEKIIIYTQNGCSGCTKAIDFFMDNNLEFIERKLTVKENLDQFKQDGGIATPYILIHDKSLIGFDEQELKDILQGLGWLNE